MLRNEMKCFKVVLWQFVQQLLDLEHSLRLILNVIGCDHRLVQFYEHSKFHSGISLNAHACTLVVCLTTYFSFSSLVKPDPRKSL